MILNGKDYDLLRKLDLLQDDVAIKYPEFLQLARQEAKARKADSHETNARKYNLQSRTVQLKVGDTVFARNFAQSNAVKKFSSKLAPVFMLLSMVIKKVSPAYYELANEKGKSIGIRVYHLKDIEIGK